MSAFASVIGSLVSSPGPQAGPNSQAPQGQAQILGNQNQSNNSFTQRSQIEQILERIKDNRGTIQ